MQKMEFSIPNINIERNDDIKMGNKIMPINLENEKKLKMNESMLWYQQKKIKEGKTLKMYDKTRVRIE